MRGQSLGAESSPVEHWDAYADSIGKNGFTFRHGKAAIPAIEGISLHADRIEALKELKDAFLAGGVAFAWPDDNVFNLMGADPGYNEAVFKVLEGIPDALTLRSGKNSTVDNIVRSLLAFGFPVAITDVEAYGVELVAYIYGLL